MRFWFQKSDKEAGTAYVGAEHEGVSAFGTLHVGKRELLHAASLAGAAVMLRRLVGRRRAASRAEKHARRSVRSAGKARKAPKRGAGMRLKDVRRPRKRKRR